MNRAAIVAAWLLCACDGRPQITSCDDDLGGVWRTETGQTWMILDGRTTLEIYPLFDDAAPAPQPPDVVRAPRWIDLRRTNAGVRGELHRLYLRRADSCDARIPVSVTACGDAIELVLGDPSSPIGFSPCSWAARPPSRRERWRQN